MPHTARYIGVVFSLALLLAGCGRSQPQAAPTQSGPLMNGQIRGIIYIDTNGNKTPDSGEAGVQSQVGYIERSCKTGYTKEYTRIDTNPDGTFLIKDLKPDTYCVYYSGDNALTSKGSLDVDLPSGGDVTVNFAVLP